MLKSIDSPCWWQASLSAHLDIHTHDLSGNPCGQPWCVLTVWINLTLLADIRHHSVPLEVCSSHLLPVHTQHLLFVHTNMATTPVPVSSVPPRWSLTPLVTPAIMMHSPFLTSLSQPHNWHEHQNPKSRSG